MRNDEFPPSPGLSPHGGERGIGWTPPWPVQRHPKGHLLETSGFRRKANHIPVAREGIPYILAAAFTTLVWALLHHTILAWLGLMATLLIAHFFRDPQRVDSAEASTVISPADGKVIDISVMEEPCFTRERYRRVSIFMSVLDVHVNRAPCSGEVRGLCYKPGGYLAAFKREASEKNEQNWIMIETTGGVRVIVTQVAGVLARRIVCWPTVGESLARGERFGLIRFGSRVDVFVPENADVLLKVGDRVRAGESVICRMK